MLSEGTKLGADIYYLANAERNEHTLAFPSSPASSEHNLFIFTSSIALGGKPSFYF